MKSGIGISTSSLTHQISKGFSYGNGSGSQRRPQGGHQRDAARGRHAGAAHHHDADRAAAPAGRRGHDARGGEHGREAGHAGPDGRRDRLARHLLRQRDHGDDRDLIPRVQRVLEDKKEKIVYLKGDKDAKYSAIMDAMDAFRKAQIENIALITEKKNKPGAPGEASNASRAQAPRRGEGRHRHRSRTPART